MNLKNLIPKDKSDIGSIEKLSQLPYPSYRPILGDLLEWVKDINWPVSSKIIPYLITAETDIVPHIKSVLNSNDSIWKYSVLNFVVNKMPTSVIYQLRHELERISEKPSEEEVLEDVNTIALNLLNKLKPE